MKKDFCLIYTVPIAATVLFIANWFQTPLWDDWRTSLLDASWQYALTKLRVDGFYFGKDVFFPYGPLSQQLGPLIYNGQTPSFFFFFLGSVLALTVLVSLREVYSNISKSNAIVWLFSLMFLFILISPIRFLPLDKSYYFATIILSLAFYLHDHTIRRQTYFYLGLFFVLAVMATQIKFSLGLFVTAVFCLALLTNSSDFIVTLLFVILFLLANYVLFFFTTGSLAFHKFLFTGMVCSALYSDTQVCHEGSETIYLLGAMYAVFFVLALYVMTLIKKRSVRQHVFLIISGIVCTLLLFKASFVRADAHSALLYRGTIPTLILVCAILASKISQRQALVLIAFLTLPLYASYQQASALNPSLVSLRSNWRILTNLPNRIVETAKISMYGFKDEEAMVSELKERKPHLFRALTELCSCNKSEQTSITFLPWEILFSHVVPCCGIVPIPSVQIYAESYLYQAREKVAEYFKRGNAPNVIVLGDGAIDGRNSVSELTNWIPAICENYEIVDKEDDYLILWHSVERSKTHQIVFKENGPGLFFWGQLPPMGVIETCCYKLVSMFFKSPELEVRVTFKTADGSIRHFKATAYLSQLTKGVFLSEQPVTTLLNILIGNQPIGSADIISEIMSAEVLRKPGFRNIPVFPSAVPIRLMFCTTISNQIRDFGSSVLPSSH